MGEAPEMAGRELPAGEWWPVPLGEAGTALENFGRACERGVRQVGVEGEVSIAWPGLARSVRCACAPVARGIQSWRAACSHPHLQGQRAQETEDSFTDAGSVQCQNSTCPAQCHSPCTTRHPFLTASSSLGGLSGHSWDSRR